MTLQNYDYFGSRNLFLSSPFIRGDDVNILQTLLNLLPDDIVRGSLIVDGIFGPLTRNAVRDFQKHFSLKVDGVVGQETFYRLGQATGKYSLNEPVFSSRQLGPDDRGTDVSILQRRLGAFRKTYLNRVSNGIYDSFTVDAVKRFQNDFPDLIADGISGPETYIDIFSWAPIGGRTLRLGRNGLDTYFLQYYLKLLSYYSASLHGYFDSTTEAAVKDFQRDAEIVIDGIAGPQTFLALGTSIAFPQKEYLYRVQEGDSVFKIAVLFDKSIDKIIKINDIQPPDFTIFSGQLLIIPVPLTFHLLEKGDTFSSLAQQYSIPESDLKKANTMFPDTFLLPDEIIVLPRLNQELEGNIVFLNENDTKFDLQELKLDSNETTTLASFTDLSLRSIFLSKDRKTISLFSNQGKNIINYNVETTAIQNIALPLDAEYLDWSFDNQKISVNDGLIINADGEEIFSFEGSSPAWLTDNKSLVYLLDNNTFKQINIETGSIKELLSLTDDFIWFFQLNGEANKILFFTFVPPGRVTISIIFDLISGELIEANRNDYLGTWSRSSKSVLLQERDFYGEFFPWFYQDLKLFDAAGQLIEKEIYAKGLDINQDNFVTDDSQFASVMYNNDTFYPIPQRARDIYIKTVQSRLITQLSLGQMAYSPVYL